MGKNTTGTSGGSGTQGGVQRIDTVAFSDCILALDNAIKAFANAHEKTDVAAKKLYRTWSGRGRESFERVCHPLLRKLTDEEENLNEIRKSLNSILISYQEWDKTVADGASQNEIGQK